MYMTPSATPNYGENPFPENSALYFDVGLKPIEVKGDVGADFDDPAYDADDFVAVVRQDTGKVLGVHRHGYKAVSNKALYRGFDDVLGKADLDLSGVRVVDELAYDGRRCVRHYVIPSVSTEPQVGDIVQLRISVVNSFDAFNAFQGIIGGYRLWCKNGMVTLDKSVSVYARHTAGFDTQRAVDRVHTAIDGYLRQTRAWTRWTERGLTEGQVSQAFVEFADNSKLALQRLRDCWQTEHDQSGPNLWSLYNAFTRWSTHTPVRESSTANRSHIVLQREGRVRRFLASETFQALAA